MTDRKFTPPQNPEDFPAEYADRNGDKVVILGRGVNEKYPLVGYDIHGDPVSWSNEGQHDFAGYSILDLHDLPKRISTWHNVWPTFMSTDLKSREEADMSSRFTGSPRLCVYRIERDEDGGNPTITPEKV